MTLENMNKIIGLRHELHRYPELSLQEKQTKIRLMSFLKENTSLKVIDRGAWFYVVYEGKPNQPTVAFRADFDAVAVQEQTHLPYRSQHSGVAHQCGHDGHSAILVALAMEVDQQKPEKTVVFIFQHAEEVGAGAKVCAEIVGELKIDEIFAFHNTSGLPLHAIGIREGVAYFASKGLMLQFTGVTTHASTPEFGKNPAFPIAELIRFVPDLLKEPRFEGAAFCTVVHTRIGDRAFGVSPGVGEIWFTIRANQEKKMLCLQERLLQKATDVAAEHQMLFHWQEEDVFPETYNHVTSIEKVCRVAQEKGLTLIPMNAIRGSEDFGYFTKRTKGAIFSIGNGEQHPPVHSVDYDFPDVIIPTALQMFLGLIDVGGEHSIRPEERKESPNQG